LAALVRDLLSRGIGEDGRIRDPARHPELFRETPLGLLPRAWSVSEAGELLAALKPAMRSGPFGSELRKSDLVAEGVPLLGIDNVDTDAFVPRYRRFVPPHLFQALGRYAVRPGDVMVTVMGTVGRSCVVPDDIGDALSSKHVWTLSFDPERYLPLLASLQFNYAPWVHAHLTREAQGGTIASIRSSTLRSTLLPVPPLAEQRAIAEVLARTRGRMAAERRLRSVRRRLRDALREDLMTGRVRARPG